MSYRTRQRQAILQVLQEEKRPLSAQEIYQKAGEFCAGLGAATVFRTLKQLLEAGDLSKVELPGLAPHYERANGHHHHFFMCESCKQLLPLRGCVDGLSKLLPHGSSMKHHEIVIFGECASCFKE